MSGTKEPTVERRHHEMANDLLASLTWTDGDEDQDLAAQALANAEQAAAERAWNEGYNACQLVEALFRCEHRCATVPEFAHYLMKQLEKAGSR